MSDDATRPVPREPATERLGTAGPPAGTAAAERPGDPRRPNWVWVLVGLLAFAVVVLLILLFLRPAAPTGVATATPTPSAAPTASTPSTPPAEPTGAPAPEPTPEPTSAPAPPPATGPVFTAFAVEPATADCSGGATSVPLVFSWASEDATEAWIGVGTADAQAAPYESVPTSTPGYSNLSYQCSEASQVYTVTISGPSGVTHHSVTIERG